MNLNRFPATALAVGLLAFFPLPFAVAKPLQVYILAGQSNMQGSAHQSTFAAIPDPGSIIPGGVLDRQGRPVTGDNSWVTYTTQRRGQDATLNGKVKVGYGFDDDRIGPEYGFGLTMDRILDEPVLIIKTAWGGKSLAVDFRPPSAGPYQPSAQEKERGQVPDRAKVGHYYREMMSFVRATLADEQSIASVVPGYTAAQGFELAGFVWFQGWNDMCNRHHIAQYTDNMIHFIRDVRHGLNSPTLPFVVGILGVYGPDPDSRRFDKGLPVSTFRQTQLAAVQHYDGKVDKRFRGKVVAVDSGPCYDLPLSDLYWKRRLTGHWKRQVQKGEMTAARYQEECAKFGFGDGELTPDEQAKWDLGASNAEYHYLGSGQTFILIGKAFAEAMLALQNS